MFGSVKVNYDWLFQHFEGSFFYDGMPNSSSQDIDCMPSNPLENMPEALRRQNTAVDRFRENINGIKADSESEEWRSGGSIKLHQSENLEKVDGFCQVTSSNYPMNTLLSQAKVCNPGLLIAI